MNSPEALTNFFDYIIDNLHVERHISVSSMSVDTIVCHASEIIRKETSGAHILDRIKSRMTVQPTGNSIGDEENNPISFSDKETNTENYKIIIPSDFKPENDSTDSAIIEILSSDRTDSIDLRDTCIQTALPLQSSNPLPDQTVSSKSTAPVDHAKINMNLSTDSHSSNAKSDDDHSMINNANFPSSPLASLDGISLSQLAELVDCQNIIGSAEIGDNDPVCIVTCDFKDEANNNDQFTVLDQGTFSIPLQQNDAVVILELHKQSQPLEGIPLTQENPFAMEVIGSQEEERALSMTAALIASRDSMFPTNEQPKRRNANNVRHQQRNRLKWSIPIKLARRGNLMVISGLNITSN
jgi:hypothetical protein